MTWKVKSIIEFGVVCLGISLGVSRDKDKITYHLERGSRLWINGSATLGSYECKTVAVFGIGDIKSDSLTNDPGSINTNSGDGVKVAVLVRFFDCGNPGMNEDMYMALRAERDSLITYELIDAEVTYDSTYGKNILGLKTIGNLTVAGITRRDTIDTRIRILPGGKYEIVGEKTLSMLDFNIIPPTAFFGLIKADERLVVGFDLIAAPWF